MDANYSLDHIPQTPGVYLFKDSKGKILYIWKAKNLKKRVRQYFSPGSVWKQEMLIKANSIDFFPVSNESESLYLESNLIKKHQPFFNTMLKGSNAYAYIKLTKEAVPQVFLTRKKLNDGATYIWPKHNSKALKKFLQYVRQVVPYRTCPASQFRSGKFCSDYYFGLCEGWCGNKDLPPPTYPQLIKDFFQGKTQKFEKIILEKIDQAIQDQHFERASQLRDIYYQIAEFTQQQYVESAKNLTGYLLSIRSEQEKLVYVLLNFYQGKLIDVIRHHFLLEEVNKEEMIAGFDLEFGKFEPYYDRYLSSWKSKIPSLNHKEQAGLHQLLDNFFESYLLIQQTQDPGGSNALLLQLQQKYGLKKFPYQIECLDISHLGGEWSSGGLSVMIGWVLSKNRYRNYKIQTVADGDDYGALREVLIRRFKLDNNDEVVQLPDLFIFDGGKGQLGIILDLVQDYPHFQKILDQLPFFALGKGEARKKSKIGQQRSNSPELIAEQFLTFQEGKTLMYPLVYDAADQLLIQLRDEAHRFANRYRKKQASLALGKTFKQAQKNKK